ncbi:mating-type switching protein swi10 [Stemphylium lycopersici]|uniref:Mating-type switching protein swi10 n=1 Tax=Stemphylium lycopersici TaxID=183478 RepID=A0A364MV89_STELY|nr:mating-type switching protein swi10 [Stemphylium lycopersici]
MDDTSKRAAAPPANAAQPATSNPPKVQQPKPQALPSRSGPSSILVSPRQKGNPILNSVRAVAWEYSDIPADYVVGATTCALFLSLKYHRLHPEYIYNRIRDLKGQYSLRILLTMVDIENHEDPLRELSKTSLVNNVTVMLCWSAQEAGRYLELFKTFENAAPTSIRAQQAGTYSENMVDLITVPRSINKTDAVGLVSNFGSIRTAINATPEEIGLIAGWGDKKVQRWCNSVREPFRVKKAAKRGLTQSSNQATMAEGENPTPTTTGAGDTAHQGVDDAVPLAMELERSAPFANPGSDADKRPDHRPAENLNEDDEEAMREAEMPAAKPAKRKQADEDVSEGVMSALILLPFEGQSGAPRSMVMGSPPIGAPSIPPALQPSSTSPHPHLTYLANTCVTAPSFYHFPRSRSAARAVSRGFRDNATPALFRSVVACARYQALGACQNVSLHSIYSGYVREIIFDGTLYESDLASNQYTHQRHETAARNFVSLPSWSERIRWERYRTLYEEQLTVEAPDTTERRTEFALAMFSFPGPNDLDAGKHLFRHLIGLELNMSLPRDNGRTISTGRSDEIEESAGRLENLAKLLEAAQDLRHLSFGLSNWIHPAPAMYGHIVAHGSPIFSHVGLGATWPKLRSLSLQGVYANERDLIDLITRHSDTLRTLKFSLCSLCRGVWAEVVDEVIFNASMISKFTLDRVNEADRLSTHDEETDCWRYEGHLVIAKDGDREFVDSNPDKMSIYEAKRQSLLHD